MTDNNYWYAVQTDPTDDWGYGSYILDEAKEMLRAKGTGLIAVIDEGESLNGAICVDEIYFEGI